MRYNSHLTTDYGEVAKDHRAKQQYQQHIRRQWRSEVATLIRTVIAAKHEEWLAKKKPTLQQVQAEIFDSLAAKSKLPILQKRENWERIVDHEETKLALTIYRDALTVFVTTHPEPTSWAVKSANKLLERYAKKVL